MKFSNSLTFPGQDHLTSASIVLGDMLLNVASIQCGIEFREMMNE